MNYKKVHGYGSVITLSAKDFHMQVCKTTSGWQSQLDHVFDGDRVVVQVIKQRAVFMIVWDQPQLSPCAIIYQRKNGGESEQTRDNHVWHDLNLDFKHIPLLSAAMKPKMFSCRSMIVW